MIVVLKSKTVQNMDELFKRHGSSDVFVCINLDALPEFVAEFGEIGHSADNKPLVGLDKCSRRSSNYAQLHPH